MDVIPKPKPYNGKKILTWVLTLTLKLKFIYNHKLDLNLSPNYKVKFDNWKFDLNIHSTLKRNEKL
jgi:hypothetical protein